MRSLVSWNKEGSYRFAKSYKWSGLNRDKPTEMSYVAETNNPAFYVGISSYCYVKEEE